MVESVALQQWLQRLYQLHPHEIELGLDRVSAVATKLNLLPLAIPAIVVAGTNGKGTTVAALQALALAHGKNLGCYTSPHLLHFNERICINGLPLDDAVLCRAFAQIETVRGAIPLTFFEYTTLAALVCFKQVPLDLVVLEVGLGGRLDAVNIVDADIAIITSIALDHMEWLGNDRNQIAIEKAGIIRAGKPLLLASADVPPSLLVAAELAKPVFQLDRDFGWKNGAGSHRWYGVAANEIAVEFELQNRWHLPEESLAAAVQAWALLDFGFDQTCVVAAIAELQLRGRSQFIELHGKQLLLDVAHNPAAARRLANLLMKLPVSGKVHMLLGMMADKDSKGFMEILSPHITGNCTICGLETTRAFTPVGLAAILAQLGRRDVVRADSVATALELILPSLPAADLLVVCGSFYTVAGVLAIVE